MDTAVRADSGEQQSVHKTYSATGLLAVGVASGLLGGLALAVPIVIWDWVRSSHRALELPMAATAWPFGLDHFSHDQNLWWPILLGIVLLAAYWALAGVVFVALADRTYRVSHPAAAILAGAAWSFVTFIFSWYMLLPVARDGAPFRSTIADPRLYTAPTWVWILGFTLSGLVIGAFYGAFRQSAVLQREHPSAQQAPQRPGRVRPAA